MADWYVYQHDGDPLGPWSTDAIADAILAGRLAPDVWVAAPGGPRWLRALDVPVIGRRVEGIPTRPRRDSGLRLIPGAFSLENGLPAFGSTMMIVRDHEIEPSAGAPSTVRTPEPEPDDTAKMIVPARAFAATMASFSAESDPPTDPGLPPSSAEPETPVRANEVDASPSTDRRRRRKA